MEDVAYGGGSDRIPVHQMSSDVAVARVSGPAKCLCSNLPLEDVLMYLSLMFPPLLSLLSYPSHSEVVVPIQVKSAKLHLLCLVILCPD